MIYVFGDCELDLGRYELRRAGAVQPVEPQVFDVLALLLRERKRVVPKEELLDAVWGSRFVGESALTSRVKAARRAIGDDGRTQRLIRTVHGRGYQFVAEVSETEERPVEHPWSRALGRRSRRSGSVLPLTVCDWRTPRWAMAHRW